MIWGRAGRGCGGVGVKEALHERAQWGCPGPSANGNINESNGSKVGVRAHKVLLGARQEHLRWGLEYGCGWGRERVGWCARGSGVRGLGF